MSLEQLVVQKYHPLFDEVGVTLETSFACAGSSLVPTHHVSGLKREKIDQCIHTVSGEKSFSRVYNPAFHERDGSARLLYFVPLVDETNMLFHRVCLRQKQIKGTGEFRAVAFARFGEKEKEAFLFEKREDAHFLPLDYLGKTERFVPLFIKTGGGEENQYWCLTARHIEDPELGVLSVVLGLEPTIEACVPEHLQEYEFEGQRRPRSL